MSQICQLLLTRSLESVIDHSREVMLSQILETVIMEVFRISLPVNLVVGVTVKVASVVANPDVITFSGKVENRCVVINILHESTCTREDTMLHKNNLCFFAYNGLVSDSK